MTSSTGLPQHALTSHPALLLLLQLAHPPHPPAPPTLLCCAAESCRKFQRLSSMGFKSDQIVGALILANGDETVATETCLDASAS